MAICEYCGKYTPQNRVVKEASSEPSKSPTYVKICDDCVEEYT